MIRTAYNNRFRDHKSGNAQSRGQRPGRGRESAPRRDAGPRRELSTVVHPWMSLPERLAATQAAMRELAGEAAFKCPLGDALGAPPVAAAPAAEPNKAKAAGPSGVHVIIRKRRLPAGVIPSLTGMG